MHTRVVPSAMILAAGFGTRLRPLTLELPKPGVPVGDRPLIAHIARACRAAGIDHLLANAHHEHDKLSMLINDLELKIHVVVEAEIMGTAGGVAGARSLLGTEPVVVWNGDILADPPLAAMLGLAAARDAQVMAIAPRPLGEGNVGVDEHGAVVRLRGQVFGEEVSGGDYVGVMALGSGVLLGLPSRGCLVGDVALPQLARGARVWTLPTLAPWSDLGDLARYAMANFDWLERTQGARASWCSPEAHVESGVTLERCLVGRGASVTGNGPLRRVIVWPNATARAPLDNAVVLTSGLVVPFELGPASAEN